MLRRALRIGLICGALIPCGIGALALSATGASAQHSAGTREVTPDELRVLAMQALAARRPDVAATFADALLQRDPGDHDARLLRSRAMRDMGRTDEALADARTAWRQADTRKEKFDAAMFRAQALSSAGRRSMAQIWLRRASDLAPNEEARQVVARDFDYVRARNPWATNLTFSISPSSNINNGSSRERVSLFGLPFELTLNGAARALSGTALSFGLDTRYRFAEDATHAHDVLLELYHRTYVMSEEAKRLAPAAEGRDFAFSSAAIGYGFRMKDGPATEHSVSVMLGTNWYGGDPYGNFLRGEYNISYIPAPRTRLAFGIVAENRFGAPAPEASVGQFFASLDRRVGRKAQVGVFGSITVSDSLAASADYRDFRVGIYATPGTTWLGAEPTLSLSTRRREYDRSPFSFFGREDEEIAARLDLVFRNVDYLGFNPTVSFNASRVESSVDLFDTEQVGVQVGIRSAF